MFGGRESVERVIHCPITSEGKNQREVDTVPAVVRERRPFLLCSWIEEWAA